MFKYIALPADLMALNIGLSQSEEAFVLKGQVDRMAGITDSLIAISLGLDAPKPKLTEIAISSKWKLHFDILQHQLPYVDLNKFTVVVLTFNLCVARVHIKLFHGHSDELTLDYIYQLLLLDLKLFPHTFVDAELKNMSESCKIRRQIYVDYYRDKHGLDGSEKFMKE